MKQTVEEAAKEAIHKHYNCNGTYPCSEREYCEHCNGCNTAFDCNECGADEYKEGFIAGVEWEAKQSPWIGTNERLPNEDEIVLCRMKSNGAIVSGYVFISPDNLPCVSTSPDFEFEDYGGYVWICGCQFRSLINRTDMKYICIKECCTLNFQNLTIKTLFRVGQIYEFHRKPDKEYFKKVKNQLNNK